MTELRITAALRARLLDHAAGGYPLEVCGLLIGVGEDDGAALRVTRTLPCPNVAPADERRRRFAIEPRAVINVQRALRGTSERILGFYHSHPDAAAEPSATDMNYVRLWPETVWLIVPVARGAAGLPRAWWLDGMDAAAPRELALRTVRPSSGPVPCPDLPAHGGVPCE